MSRQVIRLGDKTSHGGNVVQISAPHYTVGGIPVAREGDLCSCPKKGHDHCVIASGNPNFIVEGKKVAYDGDVTSCGAVLQASGPSFEAGS